MNWTNREFISFSPQQNYTIKVPEISKFHRFRRILIKNSILGFCPIAQMLCFVYAPHAWLYLVLRPLLFPLPQSPHLLRIFISYLKFLHLEQSSINKYKYFSRHDVLHRKSKRFFTCKRWHLYIYSRDSSSWVCVYCGIIHFLLITNFLCEDTIVTGLFKMLANC